MTSPKENHKPKT